MTQESVQARNRTVEEWFGLIRAGSLRLPRFQRHEAWDRGTVVSLMETVLRGLPAGAALVLNVSDPEPFISRHLVTAPEVDGHVTEHLLDGQQRLTALWRSLHGTYEDLNLFISWQDDPDHDGLELLVVSTQPRWRRGTTRYPVWCDQPRDVFERGLIPVTLLAPGSDAMATAWLRAACDDAQTVIDWLTRLSALRHRVSAYNIPYLYLPQSTPRDVALDVFVKMNTSNFKLTAFDVVVAQVEAAAGASMHEILDGVHSQVPRAADYGDLGTLLLDVACLHSGRAASKANYLRLDYETLADHWIGMVESLQFMVGLLESEAVFDDARLPSSSVLPVLAALARDVPRSVDAQGRARAMLRYYVWRAFLTRRYESSTATRAYQDYTALRDALRDGIPISEVAAPIFDESAYPLPTVEQLMQARWPKSRDILARGVLALSLKEGARDIADDAPATADSVKRREYHHLFPDSILIKRAGLPTRESFRALNCALISWQTNREVSNDSPLEYLAERVEGAHQGEAEVAERLASHLVPWESLKASGPYPDRECADRIIDDYNRFLSERAVLIADRAASRAGAGLIGADGSTTDRAAVVVAPEERAVLLEASNDSDPTVVGESDPPIRPQPAAGSLHASKSSEFGVTDSRDLHAEFERAMKHIYNAAKSEVGYTATIFARMLADHGGISTAQRLLATRVVSDGFVALWERGRMDLTVEHAVLQPRFEPLFADEERDIARIRLREYGLDVD